MTKISKVATLLSLLVALTVPFAFSSAKNSDATKYTVFKNKQELAKVSISTDRNTTQVTIERPGQSAHTYTKFIASNDISIDVGGKKFLAYNNTSGDYQLQNLKNSTYQIEDTKSNVKQLKWTENKLTLNSLAIQNQLSEDMKILRVIRNYDDSVKTRSFELAYVILTADESIYWMKDFDGYNVKTANRKVKGNLIQPVKYSLDAGCGEGCDSRLAACIRDVPASDRIECYRIADGCHGRCDGPAPVGTPEN